MSPAFRYADAILVVVVAIPAMLLGVPVLGYLLGGGMYVLGRVLEANQDRLLQRFADPRQFVGARLFAGFGRIWLYAAGIVIAGVAGQRQDGLTAAVVIFAAYSVAFAIRLISGPPQRSETP